MSAGIDRGPGAGAEPALRDVRHARTPPDVLRLLIDAALVIGGLQLVVVLAGNPQFEWPVVARYLTDGTVLRGLSMTLGLTVVAMVIGTAIGLALAMARLSGRALPAALASLYVGVFRGTPLLVQLLFWYNLSTLFPEVAVGLPFGPELARWKTNDLITPLTAAICGLALNEAAYMAEIIRGGLLAVDPRQMETAQAFGMTRGRALRRIVIPQAMRAIVPPTGNQLISMVKATSMVSVIAMGDLLHAVQNIYNATFQVVPLLMVAVIWYLAITTVLYVVQSGIERHYARGVHRESAPAGWWARRRQARAARLNLQESV
ncbi:amino acid ABC transporter permease [Pseudaquabacterium rugosum]|uniref:Amino acid ABC transporter permease n=1 Tax=Pseudaquabacterium rugosum TaxID=2984194 RepID=A0ABU9BCD5_9BURK